MSSCGFVGMRKEMNKTPCLLIFKARGLKHRVEHEQ